VATPLLSVEEALGRVLADAKPLPAVEVPLVEAHGRVLASNLAARRTQPPDAVSAMDGYAVLASDLAKAPATLNVVGEVAAGKPLDHVLKAGEAARIFTGGVVPQGADAVVVQEQSARDGNRVTLKNVTTSGKNIRPKGLDFKEGEVLFEKGHRLTSRDLALVAAMNHPLAPVHRKPKVAIFATGDELVPPGSTPGPGQIVYSNGFALMALLRAEGAEVIDLGIVADRLEDTVAAVRRAKEINADVLVTTGGASVGDYDLVQSAFTAEGMALAFWKIAMRPGRPLMSGRLGAMHVLGLPGNPVSSYVCALLFAVPLLRALEGRADTAVDGTQAVLGADMAQNDERADYVRATLTPAESGPQGLPVATPFQVQDSSTMGRLSRSDCLIVRPAHDPAVAKGSLVRIVKLPL
jgi:molybdopterin molybdotransferase